MPNDNKNNNYKPQSGGESFANKLVSRFPMIRPDRVLQAGVETKKQNPDLSDDDVTDALEMSMYQQPEIAKDEDFKTPANAPAFKKMLDKAKEAGVQAAPGIIPTAFMAMGRIVAGGGPKDVEEVYDKRRQIKQTAEQTSLERQMAGEEYKRDRAKEEREQKQFEIALDEQDPNSERSKRLRELFKQEGGLSLPENMSASMIKEQFGSLADTLDREVERELAQAERESAEAYKQAQLGIDRANLDIKLREEGRKADKAELEKLKAERAKMDQYSDINYTLNAVDNVITGLETGELETGPLMELIAPVTPDKADAAGMVRQFLGAVRQGKNPPLETLTAISSRMKLQAKELYDLGVMSKDDWQQAEGLTPGAGKTPEENLRILKQQKQILQRSRQQIGMELDLKPKDSNEKDSNESEQIPEGKVKLTKQGRAPMILKKDNPIIPGLVNEHGWEKTE